MLYSVVLFLHVVAALGLGAALGIEWTALPRLRSVTTLDAARPWAGALRPLRLLGGPGMLVLLVTGGYMMGNRWGSQPWIIVALVGLIVLGVLGGGIAGRRFRAIGAALRQSGPQLDPATRQLLADPALRVSLHMRTTLLIGIILLMTVRPGWVGSSVVLATAALAGLATGVRSSAREPVPQGSGPAASPADR